MGVVLQTDLVHGSFSLGSGVSGKPGITVKATCTTTGTGNTPVISLIQMMPPLDTYEV